MDREIQEPQTESPSEDASTIADAIFAGMCEIAGAIREVAKALKNDGEPEDESTEFYLDGTPLD